MLTLEDFKNKFKKANDVSAPHYAIIKLKSKNK